MRGFTILLSFAILASFLVRHSDAVACESLNPDVPAGCTNCDDPANETDDDCTTTTTTTTEATTTATTTTTTATNGSVTLRPNRRIVRISNLRYTNIRRLRVNRNGNNSQNRGRRNVRNGNRNRRSRNIGNVRVIRG